VHNAGTSFAAPYTAGVIALWLQQRQQQAADAGVSLDAASVSHDAVLRGLVSTARGVPDRDNKDFLESVALMGAGKGQGRGVVGGDCARPWHGPWQAARQGRGLDRVMHHMRWQQAAGPTFRGMRGVIGASLPCQSCSVMRMEHA
jgi:hypothetical protein